VLLVCCQTHTLLHAGPGGVVLEVEQVLCVPSKQSHPDVEVRALEVRHGLKALLPYRVLLILNWEKHDRLCCCSGEAVLAYGGEGDVHHHLDAGVGLAADDGTVFAYGGEGDVHHHLDAGVGLAADDGTRPRLRGVKGYHHANLTPIQTMGLGQSATVDRCVP
jgi:hypothetical protein